MSVLGLGVDVVDLERFAKVLARTPSITRRICTDAEQAYCEKAKVSAKRIERYAGRFAVKEAVHKALGRGVGAFRWRDIEVVKAPSGAPSLALAGSAAAAADVLGISRWHVTTTHDRVVVAVVIAE